MHRCGAQALGVSFDAFTPNYFEVSNSKDLRIQTSSTNPIEAYKTFPLVTNLFEYPGGCVKAIPLLSASRRTFAGRRQHSTGLRVGPQNGRPAIVMETRRRRDLRVARLAAANDFDSA